MGAASAWIGNARRVAATADWNEPAHLWLALIGAPSTGKTPALRAMTDASRALESDAEPAWRETLAQYERDAEAAKARDKTWREAVWPSEYSCNIKAVMLRIQELRCNYESLQPVNLENSRFGS